MSKAPTPLRPAAMQLPTYGKSTPQPIVIAFCILSALGIMTWCLIFAKVLVSLVNICLK